MSYQSVNEIEKFSFEDCVISNVLVNDEGISFDLEALIVLPENSQNTNYTESYAQTVHVNLNKGKICTGVREGYKYYDANDRLLEEIADEPLTEKEIRDFLRECKDYYLLKMPKEAMEGDRYVYGLLIEVPKDEVYDTSVNRDYLIKVSFSQAVFKWDHYLNRVQR